MARGIEFLCPHCQSSVRVPAKLAGEAGRCPSCERMLRVPSMDANVELSSQSARNPFKPGQAVGQDLPDKPDVVGASTLELAAVALAPLVPCAGLVVGLVALIQAKRYSRPVAVSLFAMGLALVTGLIYSGITAFVQAK